MLSLPHSRGPHPRATRLPELARQVRVTWGSNIIFCFYFLFLIFSLFCPRYPLLTSPVRASIPFAPSLFHREPAFTVSPIPRLSPSRLPTEITQNWTSESPVTTSTCRSNKEFQQMRVPQWWRILGWRNQSLGSKDFKQAKPLYHCYNFSHTVWELGEKSDCPFWILSDSWGPKF